MIGLSPGNGHPFSWSAICNGYDPAAMAACGFPAIPKYLAERRWPEDRLPDVQVTHVWAQQPELARQIADAALVPQVVAHPEAMLGAIDGLLLARDDAANHLGFAAPFLAAGVPVYIDKPVALNVAGLEALLAAQARDGLVFSCSALRYADELQPTSKDLAALGPLRYVAGMTPKHWDTYAVHVIEPILRLLGDRAGDIHHHTVFKAGDFRGLTVAYESGVTARFETLGAMGAPISLRVVGEDSWRDYQFRDPFTCFRRALADFLEGLRAGFSRTKLDELRRIVQLIELGAA